MALKEKTKKWLEKINSKFFWKKPQEPLHDKDQDDGGLEFSSLDMDITSTGSVSSDHGSSSMNNRATNNTRSSVIHSSGIHSSQVRHSDNARPLVFFNTLTKKKEIFKPIHEGKAGVYNCGPTVYDYAHIGNLRSYIFADILRRTLEWNGYKVKQVINITDVGHLTTDGDEGEDKMTKALKREGKPITLHAMKDIADFYADRFFDDLRQMNIDVEKIIFPRASETIPEQIALISELENKGFTYEISDGVYFDTTKFADYGKLGQSTQPTETEETKGSDLRSTDIKNGLKTNDSPRKARVAENPEKKHPRDFALWKFDNKLGWQSPWGKGFPGWHIECSAMSMSNLGATIDIHTGGIDHIPVHHTNEIAQSEAATGEKYVNYWMHNEFIRQGGSKMAKSAGGFLRLKELGEKGISPLVYRYWMLGATYRNPIDFSWEALETAKTTYHRLLEQFSRLKKEAIISQAIQKTKTGEFSKGILNPIYLSSFRDAINDDLNTTAALSALWQLLGDAKISSQDKVATVLEFDRVLGLDIAKQAADLVAKDVEQQKQIPADVRSFAERREQARRAKDWKLADELRAKIEKRGYTVKDVSVTEGSPAGFELKKI